jgi:hypothetical protein
MQQIARAVAVRIVEGAWVDLVNGGFFPPRRLIIVRLLLLKLLKVCIVTVMRGQAPGLSSHPKALDLNGSPSLWKGNATCAPAPYIMSIGLDARQSKKQTHEKPLKFAKKGPACGCSGNRSGRYSRVCENLPHSKRA